MPVQIPAGSRVSLDHYGDGRGLALENNQWGKQDSGANGQQAVWYDEQSRDFGWQWNWNGGQPHKVTAYPEVMFGYKPWSRRQTLCRLQALQSLRVDYAFTTQASGHWNAAFEVWLTSSAIATENHITAEIMVWVARHGDINPAGGYPTKTWPQWGISLHEGHTGQWPIYTFAFDQALFESFVDWRWFLNELVMLGRISNADYVTSVEFGNEIIGGQGQTRVRRFDVQFSA